jgi:hypothetical protein
VVWSGTLPKRKVIYIYIAIFPVGPGSAAKIVRNLENIFRYH